MFEKFANLLIKHPGKLLLLYIIILVLAGFTAVNLQLEPSVDKLVSSDSEYNNIARVLEYSFHENDAISVLLELNPSTTIRNPTGQINETHIIEYVDRLQDIFLESTYVERVGELQISDDGYYGIFTVFLFVPEGENAFKPVLNEMNAILDQAGEPAGIDVRLAGFPYLLDRIGELLITDNLKTVILTFILIFSILYFYFGNLRLALISISTPLISLLILAAFMVMNNIAITITLAAVGVLILGLGADYGIHLIVHYDEKLKRGVNRKDAITESLQELTMPIVASFVTTLAGFTALMFGESPTSQDQGVVLGIGITIIFFVTLLVLPLLLTMFVRNYKEFHNKLFGIIQKKLIWFMIRVTRHPKTFIFILGIMTVVMVFGMMQVQFSTSDSNWIPNDDPVSLSFRQLSYIFGDADTLTLVFQSTKGDLRKVETVKDIQVLEQKLKGVPSIDIVESPFTNLPLEYSGIINELDRRAFNKDFTISSLTIVSETFDENYLEQELVLQEVQELVEETPIYHAEVGIYGDEVRFTELEESIQADTGKTTMISLVLVFIVSTILYLSIVVGITSLIPIVIGVVWAIGLMGYFNVPFTSLSSGIVALVLGVGVDFSIHLVNSLNNEIKRGKNIEKATESTFKTTGWAILLSSMTTFLGFMALSFAELLGTRRLGWSLALAILSVFIVSIILVPSIVSLQAKRLKKKMRSEKK